MSPPSPTTSSTIVSKRISIFGCSRTRSTVRGLRGERRAAVQDDHPRRVLRQRQRLLQRGISAPDDADNARAQERTVAARAVAHALAAQSRLARNPERPRRRAGCNDNGSGPQLALARRDAPASFVCVESGHRPGPEIRARTGGLFLHHRAQLIAGDPVGKAGIAVDPFDTQQLASKCRAGHDARLWPGACTEQARGQAGDAAADDHYVVFVVRHRVAGFTPRPSSFPSRPRMANGSPFKPQ